MITVLLPVYNCAGYVGAAIESILAQTWQDFEFLIIDDGSTDDTPSVLSQYRDPRIRHLRHANRGLAATLNVGLRLARGKYIARQDQDDLSLPHRLEKQVAYMENNPNVALLGTWAQIIEGDILVERFHRHPDNESLLKYHLLFNNYFVHSSVMMCRDLILEIGGYSTDPERQPPEDYELWSRVARVAGVANLPEVLLQYREIPGSMSRQGPSPFRDHLVKICAENIGAAANVAPDDEDIQSFAAIVHGATERVSALPDLKKVHSILCNAAKNLSGGQMTEVMKSDIDSRVASLKSLYLLQKSPLRQFVNEQGTLRRMLKHGYNVIFRRQGAS